MRILILLPTHAFPTDTGQRHRYGHLARHLAARHEVALVYLTAQPDADQTARHAHLFSEVVQVTEHGTIGSPWQRLGAEPSEVFVYRSARLAAEVRRIVDHFSPDVLISGEPALTQRCELDRRSDVTLGELGEVRDDLLGRHTGREIVQDVVDGDARTDETGLAAPDSGAGLDQLRQVYAQGYSRRTPAVLDYPRTVRRTIGADVQSVEGIDARSETVATKKPSKRITNSSIESHVQV